MSRSPDQPLVARWPLACLILEVSYLGAYTAAAPDAFFSDTAAVVLALGWPAVFRYLIRVEFVEPRTIPLISMAATALPIQLLAFMAAAFSLYSPQAWALPAAWLCLAATAAWHGAMMDEQKASGLPHPAAAAAGLVPLGAFWPGMWTMLPLVIPADILTLLDLWYRQPALPGAACGMIYGALLFPLWLGFSAGYRAVVLRWVAYGRSRWGESDRPQRWVDFASLIVLLLVVLPAIMIGLLAIIFVMPRWY